MTDKTTSDGEAPSKEPRRQLYGRSKGKALRAAQAGRIETMLPKVQIDLAALASGPNRCFRTNPPEAMLEIGFGGGEHLAEMARRYPETGYFGVEPFLNGVAKLLAEIEASNLQNLKLLRGDGRDVLAAMPDASISRIYLLYPDPWPKRRQRKRRIVDMEFLAEVARVLKPGGELRFATDIDDYAGWVLARIEKQDKLVWLAETADDWRTPWPEWHRTRYEEKAIREGRVPGYFRFQRA